MKVLKTDRSCADFYANMGPVFGSRVIEQETRDRFYDDPEKIWYLIPGYGAASVLGDRIRNFWAATPEAASDLLQEMIRDYLYLGGIVPNRHEMTFREMGFICMQHRKNFLEVHYNAKN